MKSLKEILGRVTRISSIKKKDPWNGDGKFRVLIQVNPFYTEETWRETIQKTVPHWQDLLQVKFVQHGAEVAGLFRQADVCFCYGLGRGVKLKSSSVRLLYFGLSGLEFLEGKTIPDGITIESAGGIASRSVAEHSLTAALVLVHRFREMFENQAQRRWDQGLHLGRPFRSLASNRVGILGVGRNGRAVAGVFKQVGCVTLGYDMRPFPQSDNVDQWYGPEELDALLDLADIVIICLPLNRDTEGLITLEELQRMGPECILVNTSRGSIIHEGDLITALKEGHIRAAALDVFEQEPLPETSELWNLPNVIITPHIFGNVNCFVEAVQRDFIEKIVPLLHTSGQ
jgi:D-2-hydroxyacid dehydrogenase (NADP+)